MLCLFGFFFIHQFPSDALSENTAGENSLKVHSLHSSLKIEIIF